MPEPAFERLPKSVKPRHYALQLQPDLKTFVLTGSQTITLEILEETSTIKLNSVDTQIESGEIKTSTGQVLPSSQIVLHEASETATFHFESPLPIGESFLSMKFTGNLNDKMKGFYRSKYKTADGETRYAGVTQFEATDARRAFPCWDEPALKATFEVTLVVPMDRVALSNTNIVSETNLDGDCNLRSVTFAKTPVMSTYLLAVVVGEFDYVEGCSADGVNVRVYTPPGKKVQGDFALDVAVKVLPYYKEYFNVAYPLPKLDLIAIPDFAAGAMENWGLVTYRENTLLVDPQQTSTARKQWIALVVSHELAHQWFGNLVTMEWWTHLWLNEGFATWIEFLCVDYLFPYYDIWTQFVTDTLTRALELDALNNSHPIEVAVNNPSEVDEIFDTISYSKGASVIRMLHSFIGDEDFRKGMNHYLTKYQYSNTFTEDLWASLEHASGKPIAEVMSTWTKQMGFPLIKVSQRQEGTSRILTLTQEKFCADINEPCGDGFQWMVPVTISTARFPSQVAERFLLDSKSAEVTIEHVLQDDWVKVNPGTVGYYRVQYPPEMLSLFLPAIREQTLPPLDRLGLHDDLFALVRSGQVGSVEVLRLMKAFGPAERDYTVWSSLCSCLNKLSQLLALTESRELFNQFGRKLLEPVAEYVGWDAKPEETHLDVLLRSLILSRLGALEDEATLAEARQRFDAHVAGADAPLAADLRSPVYQNVMRRGDAATLETMLKMYREADLHEEKDRLARTLGCLPDPTLLRKVLDFAMTDEVRSQDKVFVIMTVALNRNGRHLAWNYFKEHVDQFIEWYSGGHLITYLVKYITESFTTTEMANEVASFFAAHPIPAAERTVQQSIESIGLNAKWLQRDLDSMHKWLGEEDGN